MGDLHLSDDQQLFRETTVRLLTERDSPRMTRDLADSVEGYDQPTWNSGAELGWTAMLVPEQFGGGTISSRGVEDASIVIEELGRFAFSGPVLPVNIVAYALAGSGSQALAEAVLPSIVAGETIATVATAEPPGRWGADATAVAATPADGGFQLQGTKSPVQDAHIADHFLISAAAPEGLTQFLVPRTADGLRVRDLTALDLGRRFGSVELDRVHVPASSVVGQVGGAAEQVEDQLALAVALQCCETVGAADRAFEMTLAYMKDRKAFGRPIGSYQALKHRAADMLLWLESAKAVANHAVRAVQAQDGQHVAASMAKAYIGDQCPAILRECLQIHGGIGYTWEHDLHLYIRRVESNAQLFGNVEYHQDRLWSATGQLKRESKGDER